MSFLPSNSDLQQNSFMQGNIHALESDVFEVITHLLSTTSRIRSTYAKLTTALSSTPAEDEQLYNNYICKLNKNIIDAKMVMLLILTSIPHSDEHDLI